MNKKILNYYFKLIKLFVENKISALQFESGYFAKWSQVVESEIKCKTEIKNGLYKLIYDIFPYIEDYVDESIVGKDYNYTKFEINKDRLFFEVKRLYQEFVNKKI